MKGKTSMTKFNNAKPLDPVLVDYLLSLKMFAPGSAGDPEMRATLTDGTINSIFENIAGLAKNLRMNASEDIRIENTPITKNDLDSVSELKKLLDIYGSDKAQQHNYHYLYGTILNNPDKIRNVFEIGLGTNNNDVISNMGTSGKPGASLRAFRDFLPNANIFGADIDDRVLFEEDRITTFQLDQTNLKSFQIVKDSIPNNFDLVIDDGLHSPDANINSLSFGLSIVKEGGWVVIEDIRWEARPIWQVIASLLPQQAYKVLIIDSAFAIVFAVQKIKEK